MAPIFFRRKKSKDVIEKASSAFVEEEEEYSRYGQSALVEADVSRILNELKRKIEEFERIREELRVQIESTPIFLPNVREEKELWKRCIHREREKMAETINLVQDICLTLQSWTEENPVTVAISPYKDRLFPF